MAARFSKEQLALAAKTVRILAAEMVERANSGHPGMPMGMAEMAVTLWLNHLRYNPHEPRWINRDRFVLSNGHGCALLYALLHLAGYDLTLDDLKSFRQLGSKTPGHPEFGHTVGVEATTGPLGQGIGNAVGMAIAEQILATRYNGAEPIIDHRIFVFAGDGDMMEGVASEASSIAGHLGLGNLIVIYDDNSISIAGETKLAFTEDVLKRYQAYGWHTQRIDGHDPLAFDRAIRRAVRETKRPSLIAARTTIGLGSPHKANTSEVHGSPLGKEELQRTKENLGWPLEPSFLIPDEVREMFKKRVGTVKREYNRWQKRYDAWKAEGPERAAALEAQIALTVPMDLRARLVAAVSSTTGPAATRKLSEKVLQVAAATLPALIGGSADLEPSTLTLIHGAGAIARDSFSGRNLHFGVREHGMGAILNGFSYYGGFIPYGSTFLTFSDYMRPAIRIAALSSLPTLFIFTHDSVWLGEDGPTHQAIEQIASLRLMPNIVLFRPADALETAVCYDLALRRREGPSVLCFTRQNVDTIERQPGFDAELIARGGYAVYEAGGGKPELVFIATGSEVALAIQAAKKFTTLPLRVVSVPAVELFRGQSTEYRESLIPRDAKRVVIEAGVTFGWTEIVSGTSANTLVIGIDRFGESAPLKVLAAHFGFTAEAVYQRVQERFLLRS